MTDASRLTVAKLKALCVLHDLPTSGRKADLVERLLEAGLDRASVGLPDAKQAEEAAEEVISLEPASEPEPEIEPEPEPEPIFIEAEPAPADVAVPLPTTPEEEILEAEVLDAIPVDDEPEVEPETPPVVPLPGAKPSNPTTLLDMVKTPKAAAVVLVLLLLGAGGSYWFGQQLQPVTVDALRYGDRMGFVLVGGELTATEGFVEPVIEQLDIEDDICRLEVSFSGTGDVAVHQGTMLDIPSQGSDDRLLGTVSVRGA
ncbi:MAG: SAP domain-containing protein, partial [Candidatus Poseidoniaceae archaeon]